MLLNKSLPTIQSNRVLSTSFLTMPPRRATRHKPTRSPRRPASKVSKPNDDSSSSGNAGTSSGSGGISGNSSPASDTTEFNPGLKYPVPKPSNAGELTLFEMLHKVQSLGIFNNNGPLAAQMTAVVAEIDQFFASLKESYPWVEKDLTTFMGLKNGKVSLGCGLEHAGEAFEITLKMATFQSSLAIKYPWVRRTLEKLRDIGRYLETVIIQMQALNVLHSLSDVIDNVLDSAMGSMYDLQEPKKTNVGASTDKLADVEKQYRLSAITPVACKMHSAGPAIPTNETPSLLHSIRPSANSPSVDYQNWASGTPINSPQWARDAAVPGSIFLRSLRIRQLTTVYLHPNFIVNKNRWMYVMAGVCPNTANSWAVGDIIFSPIVPFAFPGQLSDDFATVLSTPFKYCVCTPDKQHPVLNTWAPSELGSCHPLAEEFVLQHFYGQVPFWVYCGNGAGSSEGVVGERPGEPEEQAGERLNGDEPVGTHASEQGDPGIPGSFPSSPVPVTSCPATITSSAAPANE
ncbi:hypothetical protein FS749_014995 [Ceratobasidium sp. UAMH 11750]|nr:hypothetical protein FS749_014995 [Ceratobasidium sp. UAMH 11750]